MTPIELQECMNVYIALWKSMVSGPDHRDALFKIWEDRGFLKYDKDLFIKALYEYEDTSEKSYLAPRIKQIKDAYKTVKARQCHGDRVIVTQEEYYYELYQAEMKKDPDKRDEYLIRGCLPYVKRYLEPDAFYEYYGMSREEYERL